MKNPFIILKKKNIFSVLVILIILSTHFSLFFSLKSYHNVFKNLNNNIINSFNMQDKELSKEDIFLVFSLNEYKNLGTKLPSLSLPSEEEYALENGVFTFNLKENITIKCAGEGIVKRVGYLENGLKFVEIRHSGNVVTRYENLKIVGVGENYNLKKIHLIGSCEEDYPFIFKILKNDKIYNSFLIEDGEIKWKN